jgi:integrase
LKLVVSTKNTKMLGHSDNSNTMRHTFRSWLDAVGTSVAVQQKAMRHADIRTTMNIYGDVVTDEIVQASGKVARLAINGTDVTLSY